MRCPKCGIENKEDAQKCSACRTPLNKVSYISPQPSTIKYAGFWVRFVALIIDEAFLLVIILTFSTLVELLHLSENLASDLNTLFGISFTWLYFSLFESSVIQATPGKKGMGLIVTDVDGKRISLVRATLRYWGKLASTVTLLIGFIMIGFTEKKQGLHDMIAGTLVVKGEPYGRGLI